MQHSIGYLLTKCLRSNFVNKTVDGILRELDQLQAFEEGPNGNMRAVLNNLLTFSAPAHLPQLFMPLVGLILP